ANSAGFITLKKTKTIEEAVMLIGLKTVNMLILATSAQKVIESRYKKCEDIWKNSYRTAFYANQIAIKKRHPRLADLAYLSTLLADIGKIVFLSIKPEITRRIQEVAGNKENISSNILEEVTLGIDHATLGSLICRHWNFDEMLVQVIEFHHRPYLASQKNRILMDIVNLAYHFSEIEDRKSRFEIIDDETLDRFDLGRKDDFIELHDSLKNAYLNQYAT
ncbi:MAG: HDOD domain-containing protein, partial [Spirochaetes bacterium]|nr:HDOD domain-containing protein [Spirochaetota bacterium]